MHMHEVSVVFLPLEQFPVIRSWKNARLNSRRIQGSCHRYSLPFRRSFCISKRAAVQHAARPILLKQISFAGRGGETAKSRSLVRFFLLDFTCIPSVYCMLFSDIRSVNRPSN